MEIKKKYCESSPVHASDDASNDTLRDSPLLDLQTSDPHAHQKIAPPTTPCVTTGLGSANPDPYTHQTTPPTTPCVTAEPWPLHTPDDTSNDSLCDSPPRNESSKFANPHPQLEVRTPIAKAIWGITNIGKGKNIQEIIIHVKHISHGILTTSVSTWIGVPHEHRLQAEIVACNTSQLIVSDLSLHFLRFTISK